MFLSRFVPQETLLSVWVAQLWGDGRTGIRQKSAVQWSGVGIESMSIDDDVDIFCLNCVLISKMVFLECE